MRYGPNRPRGKSAPMTNTKRSFSKLAEGAWKRFLPVPFCFMGMGIFRVWTETLYANSVWTFPAQSLSLPLPTLDAYSIFDLTAALVLIALAACARWIAPLYKHPSAIVATVVSMVGCVCLNFVSVTHPELSDVLGWPALVCGGVGIALILMLWSEFFGCINPLRVAIYYSASIAVGALILWAFKGLSFYWLWIGTCLIPIISLVCLWRAYATLPGDSYPTAYMGDFSFPWKPVLVVGMYSFVYGMRGSIFSSYFAMNSGMGALVGALAVYLALSFYRERFDFSLMWKVAVPLMIVSLLPLGSVVSFWTPVADFCALASYTIMLVLIMVILSNLSYRYGTCALWIFAIERAVRLLTAQAGRVVGIELNSLPLPLGINLVIVVVMAALLVFTALFFFSEKQISSPWGVVLKKTIAQDRELYLEKNRIGVRCRELARHFGLTPREEDILLLIAQQKKPTEISAELYISKSTIKTHAKHVYQKLGVHSREALFDLLGAKPDGEAT